MTTRNLAVLLLWLLLAAIGSWGLWTWDLQTSMNQEVGRLMAGGIGSIASIMLLNSLPEEGEGPKDL